MAGGSNWGDKTPSGALIPPTKSTATQTPRIPTNAVKPGIPGSSDGVDVKVVEVGPDLAEEWLQRNRRNRRIRDERVERYAEQIKDGEWMLSPDAIAFDYNGKLINGQHRLKAILKAEMPARFLVATGLQPGAFKISDVGVKRTGGDILRIEGFKNPEEMASATRLMVLWAQDRLEEANKYDNVRNGMLVDMANACSWNDEHTDTQYWSLGKIIRKVNAKKKKRYVGTVPRSMMAFMVFAYQFDFGNKPIRFWKGLTEVQGFTIEDWNEKFGPADGKEPYYNPIALYKDKMDDKYDSLTRDRVLGYLIKAMNMYCLEEPHKKLRFRETAKFPKIKANLPPFLQDEFRNG